MNKNLRHHQPSSWDHNSKWFQIVGPINKVTGAEIIKIHNVWRLVIIWEVNAVIHLLVPCIHQDLDLIIVIMATLIIMKDFMIVKIIKWKDVRIRR